MSQFIESIKCQDGKLKNIRYHNARFHLTLKANFNIDLLLDLATIIEVPKKCSQGLFKCRVIYSDEINKIEFLPYKFRKVHSLKLVEDDKIEYTFKYNNRENLKSLFNQRKNCDDILIVKNGCITDSFAANAVFFDGKKWWTPDTPLLAGTQRAKLIERHQVFVTRITPDDLKKFKYAGLINAMQDLGEMQNIPISQIY